MEDFLSITLFNQTYKFRFDTDRLSGQEVAGVLLGEIEKVEAQQERSVHANKFVVLLIAALNIALDNVTLRGNCQTQLSAVSNRSAQLIRRLDSYIALHMDLMGN